MENLQPGYRLTKDKRTCTIAIAYITHGEKGSTLVVPVYSMSGKSFDDVKKKMDEMALAFTKPIVLVDQLKVVG